MANETCKAWYESSYATEGFKAQRLYPNEELCRFLGRHFFSRVPRAERRCIRVLELGCGSCSNLWMIAREGFDAYGIDLSAESIALGRTMLTEWGVQADLRVADMCALPFEDRFFHVVTDVFSSNCLPMKDFQVCLEEVRRVLVPGGLFFSYVPSANSEAFLRPEPAEKIDPWTLNGIHRKDSPFTGNHYPFRFLSPEDYAALLRDKGFEIVSQERIGRTYGGMREYFEFNSIAARLPE